MFSPGCKSVDIHFLIDGSLSVGGDNFVKQLEFVKKIVDSLDEREASARVGVTTFSSSVRHEFWMNEYSDSESLKSAIDKVRWTAG